MMVIFKTHKARVRVVATQINILDWQLKTIKLSIILKKHINN